MTAPQSRALTYAIIVTLGGFVFGLDLGVIAGVFDYIKPLWGLSDLQLGAVGAAPGFGAIFALVFAGAASDKLGRKTTILIIALLYLASAVTSAFAWSFTSLWAARFLGGLAFCSLALASMYIGEIAPAGVRGRLVAINQFNIVLGLTVAYFVNYLIGDAAGAAAGWASALNLEQNAWRWMLGSEIPFALIWLVLSCFIPESPRWLLMVGREERARAAMTRLMPEEEIDAEVEAINESIAAGSGSTSLVNQLLELASKSRRGAVLIAVIIAAVQPITGINAINTYAPIIFAQTGAEDPLWQTVWIGVVSLVANVFAFLLVDRLGRRPVVIFGLLWCVISLGLCAWGFHQARYKLSAESIAAVRTQLTGVDSAQLDKLATLQDSTYSNDIEFMSGVREAVGTDFADAHKNLLIGEAADINAGLILFAVLSFMAAFQFSIGPVMWVVLSEIFSTSVRGVAIPAAQLVTAVVNYFVQWLFPWQLSNMGARDIFLFYCVCVTVGLVALAILLPETKNKSIEQIEAELRGA